MKKILFLLVCLLFFNACDRDILKHKYADWEALMNAPENEKGWFPPLFKYNLSLKNNISDIVLFNDLDTNNVWGKFIYLNNIYKELSLKIDPYINSFVRNDNDRNLIYSLGKIGFNENKIKLYFTEDNERDNYIIWYYFIDTNEKIIYFCNLRK